MQEVNDQRQKLYVGMHNGVCVLMSSDGGRTWERGPTSPLDHAAARISASPSKVNRAYLAAYEAGVFRTDDGGHTWRHLASYPSDYAHSVEVHPGDAQIVYVGSEPSAIFRSADGGESWEECASFREVPESNEWSFHDSPTRFSHVRDLRIAPGDPDRLYAGIEVGGIIRSRDGGKSWQQTHGTDPDIHLVNPSVAGPNIVYAATAGGPYRSDDQGQNWELIDNGLQRHYTVHIAAAPDDADLVLTTVSNDQRRKGAQFYRSTNGGRRWELIESVGSGDDMAVAIDWDPVHPQRVYAGTESGKIFRSEDHGESWELMPVSVPTIAVGALMVGRA